MQANFDVLAPKEFNEDRDTADVDSKRSGLFKQPEEHDKEATKSAVRQVADNDGL